jgi:hypothetical protein
MKDSQDNNDQSNRMLDEKMNAVPILDNSEGSGVSRSNITSSFQFKLAKQRSLASPMKVIPCSNRFFPKPPDALMFNKKLSELDIIKVEGAYTPKVDHLFMDFPEEST